MACPAEGFRRGGRSDSGPGRGFERLQPALRAVAELPGEKQVPVDRHLVPRDATEGRVIRQGVLHSRAIRLPARSEARRDKPERESEEPEAMTQLQHGHHLRTWPDRREAMETGTGSGPTALTRWIDNSRRRLTTASAHELADAMLATGSPARLRAALGEKPS